MEEGNIVLIIITAMGILQVILNVYFARRNNEAIAKKDEADAFESAGQYYANLIDRLEKRLATSDIRYDRLEARYDKNQERIAALEEKCEKYEDLLTTYEIIINAAQEVQDAAEGQHSQE